MKDKEKLARDNQAKFLVTLLKKDKPDFAIVQGVTVAVYPGVFPPATDTHLLASYIHVKNGDTFLDLTTGSGALAVVAGKQGATGFAVDINADAVRNARDNFKTNNLDI